uniref:Protein Hook homolog 1-like n=1 Tax=Sinocyclocheilus grahami TaxID=75366 RepID=A0A672KNN1_SINGR
PCLRLCIRCECLQTFKTAAPCKTVKDLTSGAAMSQALHQIDPSWFNESWLARIKEDVGDNVRLTVDLFFFYAFVLAQQITDFPLPDLVRVVEQSDQVELGRLLQLILGCAVQCDRKQDYVQIIMILEESVQHVVMTAIQELMSKETVSKLGTEYPGDFEKQLKKALEDLTEVMAEKEELAQRCQELDMQVRVTSYIHNKQEKLSNEMTSVLSGGFVWQKELMDSVLKLLGYILAHTISIERDTLRETNEELRCTQAQQDQLLHARKYQTGSPSHDNLAAEMLPIEYREKFIRLQHENKMLRLQQEESENERITELQELLEEARRGRSQLDTENRLNRERIGELQQQVEDLQKALQTQGAKPEDSHLKRKLDAHMVQLNEAQDEIMKKKELLEDLQPDATQTSVKMDELVAALKKKDEDMRAMEDRYKMYLEKARDVIRALDPKLNPASAEIQSLKAQLSEKEKKIIALERECEQAKLREYEEKLIVTAWYNKSLNFQKIAIESRLSGRSNSLVPPGQSFLAQQRQVTNARRTMSINMPATSSK